VDPRDLVGGPRRGRAARLLTARDDVQTLLAGVGREDAAADVLDRADLDPDLLGEFTARRGRERTVGARRRFERAARQAQHARRVVLVGRTLDQQVLLAPRHDAVDVDGVAVVGHGRCVAGCGHWRWGRVGLGGRMYLTASLAVSVTALDSSRRDVSARPLGVGSTGSNNEQ
jgi:hypothetical protein